MDSGDDFASALHSLGDQIGAQLANVTISTTPTGNKEAATSLVGRKISQLGLKHGDMLFATYDRADESEEQTVEQELVKANQHAGTTAEQVYHNIKQLPVDDLLDKKDGKIYRKRDPKMCKHGEKGMCEYCMPLEPFDKGYQEEHSIKHLSFHAYLRELDTNTNKTESQSSFMAPLSEPDYTVAKSCPSGHPPWPEGICSKCQPSAITLQQQPFRMVDHVEFANPSIINSFIDAWRVSGMQRIGYLYGRYEPYELVPLGIKAVVEAVYEPPQQDEADGITLVLPWENEHLVDRVAGMCGLTKVGVIYTDLMDAGKGDGSVVCKRHVDSYFLSSLEIAFSAKLQKDHPTPSRWSTSGKFSSKFVTCVISGNQKGEIDISSYQVSTSAEGMVTADLIEPSVNPSVMRVKEPTPTRYVPDVFYRKLNEYKLAVQENAKPAFPVEYLLVTLTHGFPDEAKPLFSSPKHFAIENRGHLGTSQDFQELSKQLGLKNNQSGEDTSLDAISDFHMLVYIISLGILSHEEEQLLVRVAMSHEVQHGLELVESSGWQTLLTIIREST